MRPSNVLHLYRVRLRSRWVQEVLALAGIAVGVALVFAALVANTSLTGSMRQLTRAVVGGATLQVQGRSPEGFDQRLVDDIRRADGVAAAAAVVEARANIVGPEGRRSVLLIGGEPSFGRLGSHLLPNFTDARLGEQRAVGLPSPLADELGISLGQRIEVEVDGRSVTAPVGLKLQESDIDALVHSPVALAPLAFAQQLARMDGRVTRVFVRPAPGEHARAEQRLRELAGDRLDVRAADAEVTAFERAAVPTNQSTALFSVFSALVGFLFAFSAVLLTVPQRRRLVADLRLAGHEPWVLIQLLLFDALVLGAAGSLIGLALGDQLSRQLFDDVPDYLTAAFVFGSQRIVTLETAMIAVAGGMLAACVAVLAPLRDILARHPDARTPAGSWPSAEVRLALAGVVSLGVALALGTSTSVAAFASITLLTLALLLLLPLLLRLVAAAFELVGRPLRSPIPILAVLELRSRSAQLRTLSLSATGAIAVFATVAIGGAHADLERGLDASARDIDANADVWVTFAGVANTLATTPFSNSQALSERLRRLDGVHAVDTYRGGFLDIGDQRTWVLAPPDTAAHPIPPTQITGGDPERAAARLRRGGWTALSRALAADRQAEIGDRVTLPSPTPIELRVAAITTNLGWPPGAIVLNASDYARAWGSEAASALHVDVKPGSPPEAVADAVARSLGPASGMLVETRRDRTLRHYKTASDSLTRLTQISVLVLISAVLAMATAMGGMIWQRRRTLAALKVHGYPELELWRALLLESGLLLGAGCLVGAAFGLLGQVLMTRALETMTGFPVVYSTAALTAAGILATVTIVAVAMLAVPGWLAVRVRPAPGAST